MSLRDPVTRFKAKALSHLTGSGDQEWERRDRPSASKGLSLGRLPGQKTLLSPEMPLSPPSPGQQMEQLEGPLLTSRLKGHPTLGPGEKDPAQGHHRQAVLPICVPRSSEVPQAVGCRAGDEDP